MTNAVFVGIDVGTSGARVSAVASSGECLATAEEPFNCEIIGLPTGFVEQNPELWIFSVIKCLQRVSGAISSAEGIAVASTSGTLVLVDSDLNPVRPAIMYNDNRAEKQAQRLSPLTVDFTHAYGYSFPASFALPKLMWLIENEPETIRKTNKILHAGDYISAKLFDLSLDDLATDTSTALKTGCDPVYLKWADFVSKVGIDNDKLPKLGLPGDVIGALSDKTAKAIGLPSGIPLILGATDGVTSAIASGIAQPGEWNSTLGSTLIVRGISKRAVADAHGRLYSHRHPSGWWMPGGASNVGGECLNYYFPSADFQKMDEIAKDSLPTKCIAYPLIRNSERLPFVSSSAEGFFEPEPASTAERYAACLQGVALVERWIFDVIHSLAEEVGDTIYIGGGGVKSSIWNQIRSNVLQKRLVMAENPTASVGAAILSAVHYFGSLDSATRYMTRIAKVFEPFDNNYDDIYAEFRRLCRDKFGAPC